MLRLRPKRFRVARNRNFGVVLADDTHSGYHQRFVLRRASGQTALVAHTIDQLGHRAVIGYASAMDIRSFLEADAPAVIALWDACALTRPWNDPAKDITRKLGVQRELFLVGETDGALMASAMVGYDGHRGWVNYLAVHPDHRRRGHGAQLMQHAEQGLLALGCPKINLQIRSSNAEVLAFYRMLGYLNDDVVCLGKRLIHDRPADA